MHFHLFEDIKSTLIDRTVQNMEFVYSMYRGLRPRRFDASNPEDCIISEENEFVDEIVYMNSGIVNVGFSRLSFHHMDEGPYIFKARFSGVCAFLMYNVLAMSKSDFVYKCANDVSAFCLDYKFVHRDLFKGDRF